MLTALQVTIHATTGNHRLRVLEMGKFAVALNRPSQAERAGGVRVYINAKAVERFPTLNMWYTNDPKFRHVAELRAVYEELLQAGRHILSWQSVRVLVPRKTMWTSVTCTECGARVSDHLIDRGLCRSCAGTSYYERSNAV